MPVRDCRESRRQYLRDTQRQPAWAPRQHRQKGFVNGELADGAASGICRGCRGCVCGPRGGICYRDWFQGVENEAAALAPENLFVGFRTQFLKNMWQDAHAAPAALPVSSFGHGRAVVALGDARVKLAQFFRHRSNDPFALARCGLELPLLLPTFLLTFFSLRSDALLAFLHSGFPVLP